MIVWAPLALALLSLAAGADTNPQSGAASAVTTAESAVSEARAAGASDANLGEALAALEKAKLAQREKRHEDAKRHADEAWAAAQKARETAARAADRTRFHVQVAGDGAETQVAVRKGGPVLLQSEGEQVDVHAGRGAVARKGQKVSSAPLPGTPAPAKPDEGTVVAWRAKEGDPSARVVDVTFSWSAVSAAKGYELVLSGDAEGRQVVARISANEPRARVVRPLPVGTYHWRVVARNATGMRSAPSAVRSFQVTEKPPLLDVNRPVWR
jgi:hypothetical protein